MNSLFQGLRRSAGSGGEDPENPVASDVANFAESAFYILHLFATKGDSLSQ